MSVYKTVLMTLIAMLVLVVPVGAQYNEAPMLAEKVAQGELPPVAERLPDNPLVITPLRSVGKYGGTWYRQDMGTDWTNTRLLMYGFSPVRFVNDALGIEPNWIENWQSNADATEWILHIRQGTKWSDGTPLTTADFLFWWEDMALNPEMSDPVASMFVSGGEIATITALDDFTIRVEYAHPYPLLIEAMALWVNAGSGDRMIAPAHYLKQFHPDYSSQYTDYEIFEEKMEWWTNPECPVLTEWMPVEHDLGRRLVLERNPYYYAVDTDGNQLPYIDRIVVELNENMEVVKLKWMNGEADMQLRPYADMTDLNMLIDNQEIGNYQVHLWDSGSGTGPMFYWNWNHPDEEKQALYRTEEFRRAMSFGLNRERIRQMLFFGLGETTTGTMSPKTPIFHRPGGQEIFQKWTEAYRAYDPEKAKSLLDSIGVVDQNGDGWRDFPSGRELRLRIDFNAAAASSDIQTTEMAQEDWRTLGLRVDLNPVDGSALAVLDQTANFDIRNSWEIGGVPNMVLYPQWVVPVDLSRWAPLYGSWFQQEQIGRAHLENEKAPRDRTPPREEPPADGPIRRMQQLYTASVMEPSQAERDRLFHEIFQIHIDEGPFFIGTIRDYPRIVIVKNNFHNVPTREELALGGFVNPHNMPYPAITNPAQYWMSED